VYLGHSLENLPQLFAVSLTATEMIDILTAPLLPDAETVETLADFPDVPPSQVN
jgi:hypothetical protein